MKERPRKYRGEKSYPLLLWDGILEHCERIGPALWEFVWLLDKITAEKDGKGIVLGGAPVKIERIARDLARSDHTVRRNLDRLEAGKYIERTRTPYGLTIRVRNSRKFGIWSKKEIVTFGRSLPKGESKSARRDRPKVTERSAIYGRNKEDSAKNKADGAFGSVLGVEPDEPFGAAAVNHHHPPLEETARSDDDENHRHRPPTLQNFKATALTRFKKKHAELDPKAAEQWADEIEGRAFAKGTKISSAEYFETALENELTNREVAKPMRSQDAPSPDSANGNSNLETGISFWADRLTRSVHGLCEPRPPI